MPLPSDSIDVPDGEPGSDRLTPKTVDFAAVARVSTQAALMSVRMAFMHAELDETGGPIPSKWSADTLIGYTTSSRIEAGDAVLVVSCAFLAMYVPGMDRQELDALPNPEEVNAALKLNVRFQLVYGLEDAGRLQPADPDHFAYVNGTLHAWPYWREIAQSTTVRMGLDPLMIGTFKIPSVHDPAK